MAPYLDKLTLDDVLMLIGEGGKEFLQGRTLIIGQVTHGVQLMQVAQVGEQAAGIYQVLVNVVKVGQQQLTPREKLVKGLLATGAGHVTLVQLAHLQQRVGLYLVAVTGKELGDGAVGWTPQGAAVQVVKILVHEQTGTLVGKDYHYP